MKTNSVLFTTTSLAFESHPFFSQPFPKKGISFKKTLFSSVLAVTLGCSTASLGMDDRDNKHTRYTYPTLEPKGTEKAVKEIFEFCNELAVKGDVFGHKKPPLDNATTQRHIIAIKAIVASKNTNKFTDEDFNRALGVFKLPKTDVTRSNYYDTIKKNNFQDYLNTLLIVNITLKFHAEYMTKKVPESTSLETTTLLNPIQAKLKQKLEQRKQKQGEKQTIPLAPTPPKESQKTTKASLLSKPQVQEKAISPKKKEPLEDQQKIEKLNSEPKETSKKVPQLSPEKKEEELSIPSKKLTPGEELTTWIRAQEFKKQPSPQYKENKSDNSFTTTVTLQLPTSRTRKDLPDIITGKGTDKVKATAKMMAIRNLLDKLEGKVPIESTNQTSKSKKGNAPEKPLTSKAIPSTLQNVKSDEPLRDLYMHAQTFDVVVPLEVPSSLPTDIKQPQKKKKKKLTHILKLDEVPASSPVIVQEQSLPLEIIPMIEPRNDNQIPTNSQMPSSTFEKIIEPASAVKEQKKFSTFGGIKEILKNPNRQATSTKISSSTPSTTRQVGSDLSKPLETLPEKAESPALHNVTENSGGPIFGPEVPTGPIFGPEMSLVIPKVSSGPIFGPTMPLVAPKVAKVPSGPIFGPILNMGFAPTPISPFRYVQKVVVEVKKGVQYTKEALALVEENRKLAADNQELTKKIQESSAAYEALVQMNQKELKKKNKILKSNQRPIKKLQTGEGSHQLPKERPTTSLNQIDVGSITASQEIAANVVSLPRKRERSLSSPAKFFTASELKKNSKKPLKKRQTASKSLSIISDKNK